MLMQHAPAAFGDVQRYEAESKFFRSLTIALPIVGLLAASRLIFDPPIKVASPLLNALLVVVATLLLMRLSHWRYAEQRFKSTQWAYAHVIVLRLGVPVATARTGGE